MVKPGPITLILSDELSDIIRRRLEGGEFQSPEAVVRAALCLLSDGPWKDDGVAIRAKIQRGIDEIGRGEVIGGDVVMDEWDEDLRRRSTGHKGQN